MALSVQDIVRAKRRFLNFVGPVDACSYGLGMSFFSWLSQQGGNPDLQVVEFDHLTGTDVVIANAPCKVYAIVLRKVTTTAAVFKGTDNATTGSATAFNVALLQNSIGFSNQFFGKGLPMANGLTVISNTTTAGNTTSAAGDGAAGVVLLGNP